MSANYKHFSHRTCEYYPCHHGLENLNCLFCYCVLFSYPDCGGNFTILDNGVKDCSSCTLPHEEGGYDYISNFLKKKQTT